MKKSVKIAILVAIVVGVILALTLPATGQTTAKSHTWAPNPKYIKAHQQHDTTSAGRAQFQCYGTTQKGQRCKRKVMQDGDFCYQHQGQK